MQHLKYLRNYAVVRIVSLQIGEREMQSCFLIVILMKWQVTIIYTILVSLWNINIAYAYIRAMQLI